MQEKKPIKNLKIKKISIIGVIPSFAFQRAKYCALELHKNLPQKFPLPEIIGLLELDWNEKLLEWRQAIGREYWCLRRPVAVFFDDKFIGSDIELIKLTTIGNILIENIPRKNTPIIKEHFRKDYIEYLKRTKRIYCYLDICLDEVYIGTLTFQLYSDLLPRTCENFKSLCLGSKGTLFSYKGSRIHRIVKEGWLQGGDIQYKTGGGGFSIFCDPLEDESFVISHDRKGILSMANSGRNSNGSQFFITLKPSKWMDTHYVAFGQLIEGVNVLKTLENVETFYECPLKKIEIKNCGKLDLGDVEDIDAMYREEFLPTKKPKKIETISEQLVRLIMEALTDALAKKEHVLDILDDGDIPSKMNLQLYFQGFYSIPEAIIEESAQYLRNLRRQFFRILKPSATEIVEVLMHDLLMAVLTRMTTLDDIRETVGHELYQKMVGGINIELEQCKKPYVKKLVDQTVSTAESIVNLINKKLLRMKRTSNKLKAFQERMQSWVQSFVLQETFQGGNFHISDRPGWNISNKKNEKKIKKEKKKKQDLEKLKNKYPPEDICCLGSQLFETNEVELSDYFRTCRYDFKKIPKKEKEERMPLLDLIEVCRFNLKSIRKQENRMKSKERICTEKKIRKWMNEVVYTPESSWIKDLVFENDDVVFDHVEEIMYGAMTAGLLEMYYFMETYLKLCGDKKQKLITKTIYAEESEQAMLKVADIAHQSKKKEIKKVREEFKREEDTEKFKGEEDGEEFKGEKDSKEFKGEEYREEFKGEEDGEEFTGEKGEEEKSEKKVLHPCTCGHPCCVCPYDPHSQPPTPPPSIEGEEEEEEEEEEKSPSTVKVERGMPINPCGSDMELVDLNALLAEKTFLKPEEIDIRSFKWLKPYILEKGCDLKTKFATEMHKWLDGERFNYNGFLSKHSLVTRASLLSFSLSIAELIKEENKMKTEIKNFIYDLWNLYFKEMIKEAFLENPPQDNESIKEKEIETKTIIEKKKEMEAKAWQVKKEKKGEKNLENLNDICDKIPKESFDFSTFCEKYGEKLDLEFKKSQDMSENHKKTQKETSVNELESQPLESEIEKSDLEPLKEESKYGEKLDLEFKKSQDMSENHKKTQKETSVNELESQPLETEIEKSDLEALKEELDKVPQKSEISKQSLFEVISTQNQKEFKPLEEFELVEKGDDREDKTEKKSENMKKRKSPIIIEELIDESSGDESRQMPPYVLPFWVKFLTELTKQALGAIAKVSRLPKRLYFLSDSDMNFDNKMKEWFEFNSFNPQPTKGREIMDYIALHHRSLTNLEETARSYLKKKKYSELLNRCTRFTSADDMAEEIVTDVIEIAMKQTDQEQEDSFELFVANLLSSAVTSSPKKTSYEDEEDISEADVKRSYMSFNEVED